MRTSRRSVLALAVALAAALISGGGVEARPTTIRWDIVSIQPPNLLPGGIASARANDESKITIAGSGTFRIKPGNPQATGGGNFEIRDANGNLTARGTYQVTGVVSFEVARGTLPPINDQIGTAANARAGLAILNIAYSDGPDGILVVSCHLVGTPDRVFEGITASRGFVDFWNREAPSDDPFVDANRTVFHVVP